MSSLKSLKIGKNSTLVVWNDVTSKIYAYVNLKKSHTNKNTF